MMQPLSSVHMIQFIKIYHAEWLQEYVSTKKSRESGYNALFRLCQRFSHRFEFLSLKYMFKALINTLILFFSHGFSQRTPSSTYHTHDELYEIQHEFAVRFWTTYSFYNVDEIYNVDETGVYYDMPPARIWAERGGSAKVRHQQEHSDRITAVLTIRADGKKLPILFIVKGQPGGVIESEELRTYPRGALFILSKLLILVGPHFCIYMSRALLRRSSKCLDGYIYLAGIRNARFQVRGRWALRSRCRQPRLPRLVRIERPPC